MSQRASQYVYRGKKINLKLARIQLPDGRVIIREIIEHKNVVAVLPVLGADKIVLVKRFKPVVGEWILEIPSTTLEPGERPEQSAIRSLEETTGLRASRVLKVMEFYLAPDYSIGKVYLFFATDLKDVKLDTGSMEARNLVVLGLDEAINLVKEKEIRDSKTIIALLYYDALRRRGFNIA